ncbi:TPA: type II toxin-antitoxin system RelE/ParE family toxin [Candidatus Micrarchaeota archaeon]|nr:type II toxin-antitoxin system RelE/ParE family toxin [Candidatus Micrarchaeota archaeon]HIH29937.1 type II toxin-antitoxin system RelE/ParE family toxin [Candidatus Micrarchaeota archaeon]
MAQKGEFSVLLTDEALSALDRLDKSVRERVKKRLEALRTLRPARTLRKHGEVWILEIGDFRALYLIDEKAATRTIFFIGNHKEYQKRYLKMFG